MTKKSNLSVGSLGGSLLVATSRVSGSCFKKAVIYVCAHNEKGAIGIVVNCILEGLKCDDILDQLDIKPSGIDFKNTPVYFGGPVDSAKGFVLHSSDYFGYGTQILHSNISLTSTVEILRDIARGRGPHKQIIALGCAGWAPGQIENEIKENAWIIIPADEKIVFDINNEEKWQTASDYFGINFVNYSPITGNA